MTTAIRSEIRSQLHQIAVERERLRSVKEEKYLAWVESHFSVEGTEFKELNASIDALTRYEVESGLDGE